jgi:hypothetical protein
MKGDFTRNTFDPQNHFSRVLMQQGRVQLDADWNEQAAILLHYLRSLAVDLIGPYAGPHGEVGFAIRPGKEGGKDFAIGPGRYYVNGILCENEVQWDANHRPIPLSYYAQADYPGAPELPEPPYLVYLDVWERHLTDIQEPEIREVALGGPDTATRAKIVWQVKVEPRIEGCLEGEKWMSFVDQWQPPNRGLLKAGAREFEVDESTEPCNVPPESKYRGAENQLYRVEIHEGGPAGTATFKWSRENGSVVFPILKLNGSETTLEHLGRDERFSLREGDWVEIVDDGITLRAEAHPLLQVKSIDRDRLIVGLDVPETVTLPVYDETSTSHPLLRRWDHKKLDPTLGYPKLADDGALELEENNWLLLEDGIQIFFEPGSDNNPQRYRTGDYWLIPARTATGDVEWPGPADAPESLPPLGIQHAYAPLASVMVNADGNIAVTDCRREINQLWTSPPGR